MKTYTTHGHGWSSSEELRSALVELGFRSGMPSVKRCEQEGRFWLFAQDAKQMAKMIGKEDSICIEAEKRDYIISGIPTHDAMECKFTIIQKQIENTNEQ